MLSLLHEAPSSVKNCPALACQPAALAASSQGCFWVSLFPPGTVLSIGVLEQAWLSLGEESTVQLGPTHKGRQDVAGGRALPTSP